MKYSVELTDKQRDELLTFYNDKIQALKKEIQSVQEMIDRLSTVSQAPENTNTREYRENWSWAIKVRYVLIQVGRCLSTRDIIDEISKYETLEKDPINSVSGTLSSKVSAGIMFGRYQPYHSEYYFGLIEWFNEDGTVKDKYAAI